MAQQNLLPKFGSPRPDDTVAGPDSVSLATAGGKRGVPEKNVTNAFSGKAVIRSLRLGDLAALLSKLGPGKWFAAGHLHKSSTRQLPRRLRSHRSWISWNQWPFRNPFRSHDSGDSKEPFQTQLVLDAVLPVRNDLADGDAQFIFAGTEMPRADVKAPGVSLESSVDFASIEAKSSKPGPTWQRVKAQLFGSGKI
jgi:hypothetical protein